MRFQVTGRITPLLLVRGLPRSRNVTPLTFIVPVVVQAGVNDFFLDETTSIADSSALHLEFSLALPFLTPLGVAKYF